MRTSINDLGSRFVLSTELAVIFASRSRRGVSPD
jgi:hypothetical protein